MRSLLMVFSQSNVSVRNLKEVMKSYLERDSLKYKDIKIVTRLEGHIFNTMYGLSKDHYLYFLSSSASVKRIPYEVKDDVLVDYVIGSGDFDILSIKQSDEDFHKLCEVIKGKTDRPILRYS